MATGGINGAASMGSRIASVDFARGKDNKMKLNVYNTNNEVNLNLSNQIPKKNKI
tara:strand:- start:61 stop:225 length:165 start_codon:yes stop_codon:yes gene_type:complete